MAISTPRETTGLIEDEERDHPTLRVGPGLSDSAPIAGVATPLPWRPFFVLLLLTMMQPLAYEVVFPFLNQMILELGIVTDPERVGFYSGLIESIFACMSLIAILPSSALANRIGRKPVILVGMLGLAVSVACFGMSKSFLGMVLSRCLGGTLGGAYACIKIMIGEMTDKSNQGMAFTGSTIAHRTGQIIGLPLGGLLAHPERNFPLFQNPFWYAYPFALPCFVAAGLCLSIVTMGYFALPETLAPKQKKPVEITTYGTMDSATDLPPSRPPSRVAHGSEESPPNNMVKQTYKMILTPPVVSLLCSSMAMCLASEMLFAVFPLFLFTPVSLGGLGMSEAAIGTQMSIRSMMCVGILVFFSPLERRLGTVGVYQLSMWMWPLTTLFFPLLNFLARRGAANELSYVVGFFIFLVIWSIGGFAWTAMAIMVTDNASSADALATMNGLSQMTLVFPQAVAPAFVNSLFAASIQSDIAGGQMVWIILFIMTTIAAMHSMVLREPGTDWRQAQITRMQ